MLEQVPVYVSVIFIATALLTVFLLFRIIASVNQNYRLPFLLRITLWAALLAALTIQGYFLDFNTMPPRFILAILPPLLLIVFLFAFPKSRNIILQFSLQQLTLIHIVRVPVEIVLYWLFISKAIPEIMTFEGRNFDILAGFTAPLMTFFAFKEKVNKTVLIIWNFLCLALLFNIVITAVLSAPLPFQQLAHEQPNIGVFYFPFIWLPAVVVPVVLFSHIASLVKLFNNRLS